MPRGGRRPGAGRPKGTNQARQDAKRAVMAKAAGKRDLSLATWKLIWKWAQVDAGAARFWAEHAEGKAPLPIKGELEVNLKGQIFRCVDEAGNEDEPGGGH